MDYFTPIICRLFTSRKQVQFSPTYKLVTNTSMDTLVTTMRVLLGPNLQKRRDIFQLEICEQEEFPGEFSNNFPTPPKVIIAPKKMDGWKMILSF